MTNLKTMVCALTGALGGMFSTLFGGWTRDMATLLIFMAVDFAMGLMLAGVFKNSNKTESGALDSHVGWMGLCKKCVTLLFVLVAHRLDISLNVEYIKTATVIAFIVNEAISIIENAGLMGLPLPEVVVKAINVLKQRKGLDFRED